MANPILKDTLREIRKTKGRFFSIMGIVLIGVAFFSGVWATAPDMRYSADKYFDDYHLMDYRILSNFGLTKDDIRHIKSLEGIEAVYPTYTQDFIMTKGELNKVIKVSTYNQNDLTNQNDNYLNRFVLVKGRLPSKPNEMIIENSVLPGGFQIGDKVFLDTGTKDEIDDVLKQSEYEIVGLIQSPYYLTYVKGSSTIGTGNVDIYGYINEVNFLSEYYTEVFVTIDGAREYNTYDESYFEFLKSYKIELESLGYQQSAARSDEIREQANAKLLEAKDEYEKGKQTFEDEIAKAEKDIEKGKEDILLGKAQIQASELVLESQLASGRQQIDTLKKTVEQLETQYKIYKQQYEEANKDAIEQRKQLVDTKQQKEVELATKKKEAEPIYAEISDNNTKISTLNQEITTLQANKTTKQARIDEILLLLADLDPSEPEYQLLEAERVKLENEIIQLDQDISAKQAEITRLEARNTLLNSDPKIAEINTLETEITRLTNQIALLDQALSQGDTMLKTLRTQIDSLNDQIKVAEDTLKNEEEKARTQIAKGKRDIDKAEKDLIKGEMTLADEKINGQVKLDDAKDQITKAENEILLIDDAKWYVLDRNSHYSYVDFKGAAKRMENIALVFPVFFFLVAALVCLTTMTRFVDEQRLQIGTLKAMGYSAKTISFKYLAYAISASMLGGILGLLIGMLAFPWVIYNAWMLMYIMPGIQFAPQVGLIIITLVISVLVTTGSTLGACYKELLASPSLLMRPKAPKVGKKIMIERIGPIWNNLSFTLKVTFRNIFRYKKRMLMTIIGIAGCTGLLLAGFGIKDSISDISYIQFKEIFKYEGMVSYEADLIPTKRQELRDKLKMQNHVSSILEVSETNAIVNFEGKQKEVIIVASDDPSQFDDFYSLRSREKNETYFLSNDGAIVTEKMANDYNINVNDYISVTNVDNITKPIKVVGITENYVNHYVYMSSGYYQEQFGVKAPMNSLMFHLSDEAYEDQVAQAMLASEDVIAVNYYSVFFNTFLDMIESLNIIVIVLVISAGALAFIVLYNLTNVNISERQREIATLKVLGFYPKEVKRYVYYENILLTIFGSVVGLFVGKGLHLLVMVVVEMDDIMFGRNIAFISYLISFVLTVFFAMLVNRAMQSKLRKIEMVESLKSIE